MSTSYGSTRCLLPIIKVVFLLFSQKKLSKRILTKEIAKDLKLEYSPRTNSHCSHPSDLSGTTSSVNIFCDYAQRELRTQRKNLTQLIKRSKKKMFTAHFTGRWRSGTLWFCHRRRRRLSGMEGKQIMQILAFKWRRS